MSLTNQRNFLIYFMCCVYLETLLSAAHAGTTIILPENVVLNKNSTSSVSSASASSAVQNFTSTSTSTSTGKIVGKSFKSSSAAAPMGMMMSPMTTSGTFQTGREAVLHVLQCIFQKDTRVQCFLDRAQRALDYEREKLLAQADSEVDPYYHLHKPNDNNNGRASTTNEKPTAVTNIITELTDMLSESVGTFFTGKKSAKDIAAAIGSELTGGTGDDEEDDDDADEVDETETNNANAVERTSKSARGKKKKKPGIIHKLLALIKVLLIALALKIAIEVILRIIMTKLQVKYFLVTLAYLILNALKFWYWVKKEKHGGEEYIVYEHDDHHHHHPEVAHHHHDSSGWGDHEEHDTSSYWDRVYRNAAPEVIKRFGQSLAYSGHRPIGVGNMQQQQSPQQNTYASYREMRKLKKKQR